MICDENQVARADVLIILKKKRILKVLIIGGESTLQTVLFSLIFSEFNCAFFEKPIIFDFVRIACRLAGS